MSRIGEKPIRIPSKVQVRLDDGAIVVEGPRGKVARRLVRRIEVKIEKDQIVLDRPTDSIEDKMQHGTMRSLLANMVKGVTDGFQKRLVIEGVGFRAQLQGKALAMTLGFSHPIVLNVPEGLTVKVPSVTEILVEGIDKEQVGQFASDIRSHFRPEPYKGKGIRYSDEVIRRKAGKTVASK